MKKKRIAKDPLLYIHQPSIQTPEASMQTNYQTPREKGVKIEHTKEKQADQTKPLKRHTGFSFNDDVIDEYVVEEKQIEGEQEEITNQNEFKDMSLQERVEYFVNMPDNIPSVKCELKTADKTFHGTLTAYEDDHVFIRVGRRSSSTKIPFIDVKSIQLVGF